MTTTTTTTTTTEALGACVNPSTTSIPSSRFGQDRRRRSRRRRTTHHVLMCVGGGEQQQQPQQQQQHNQHNQHNHHHHQQHQHDGHELSMSSSHSSSTTTSPVAASSMLLIPSSLSSSAAKSARLQDPKHHKSNGFTRPSAAANQLVHNLMLSQQHRSTKTAGVSHLLNSKYPAGAAVLTNGGGAGDHTVKDYYCVGNNNNNNNSSNNKYDSNSSAAVVSVGGYSRLSLLSALLLPLYQRVRDFLVSIVYASPSATVASIEDISTSTTSVDHHADISNSKHPKQTPGSLLFTDCCEHNNKNHVLAKSAGNLLHSSLLQLIAMEAVETTPPPPQSGVEVVSIDSCVDKLTTTIITPIVQQLAQPEPVAVKSAMARPFAAKPAARMTTPAKKQQQQQLVRDDFEQPPSTETTRLSKRQLKRQRKREAHQRRLAMAAAAVAAATASPATCASAGRVKSPSPLAGCSRSSGANNSHKNRHEKGRHQLERNIEDDRQAAAEQWPSRDDEEEAVDDDEIGEDTTDCCFAARVSAGLVSFHCSGGVGSAGKSSAFTCVVRGDNREMPVSVDCGVAIAVATVTVSTSSHTTPASNSSTTTATNNRIRLPPSLSWDISADELRTPSAKPERLERAKLRAANRRLLANGLEPSAVDQQIRADLMHQLLLQPRRRERQISECSDDFICFERGDDDDNAEDGVDFEVNYESDESDDDEDEDEPSDDESSSSSEEDDDDDAEEADEPRSDSDCESTSTKQPDSGFEEPITTVNKVRFALERNEKFYQFHWAFAFRNSRRNYWEMVCRDRHRFMERVQRTGNALNPILEAGHRENILQRRADKERQLEMCT